MRPTPSSTSSSIRAGAFTWISNDMPSDRHFARPSSSSVISSPNVLATKSTSSARSRQLRFRKLHSIRTSTSMRSPDVPSISISPTGISKRSWSRPLASKSRSKLRISRAEALVARHRMTTAPIACFMTVISLLFTYEGRGLLVHGCYNECMLHVLFLAAAVSLPAQEDSASNTLVWYESFLGTFRGP